MHREVADIAKSADIQNRLSNKRLVPQGATLQEFEKFIAIEIAKWGKATRTAGIAAK